MKRDDDAVWLDDFVQQRSGYDVEAVERYGNRLLQLASSRLPDRLQRRIDPEDIVQSVFRSFFARHQAGRFTFQEAPDVWRLLAAMTYYKVQRTIRHHSRQQRDVKRETQPTPMDETATDLSPTASTVATMMEFLEQLLSELPPPHREMVRMRMEGYTIAEIAEQTHVSTRTVMRALKLLRKVAEELSDSS